jgi:hypothetical protein
MLVKVAVPDTEAYADYDLQSRGQGVASQLEAVSA